MAEQGEMVEVTIKSGEKRTLSFKEFYEFLSKKVLSEDQLRKMHFPRPHPSEPGKAKMYNLPHKFVSTIQRNGQRRCRFCFKFYEVDQAGNQTERGQCRYHPFSRPPPGKKYACCGRNRGFPPCKIRNYHVTDDFDENNLTNFVYTKHLPDKGTYKVYAFDCEFVHTTKGKELASIAIIDHNEEVVLNTIVKPTTPVIDYLTQFNKLTAEAFEDNFITVDEYRNKIREIMGPDVILVGHGCFNDLLHMRVIHDKVVDTSSLFPHPEGDHLLQSLKTLVENELHADTISADWTKDFADCVKTLRITKVAACKQ